MFSKSKVNDPIDAPKPSTADAKPATPAPAAPVTSKAPAAAAKPKAAPSVLSSDLVVKGNLETTGDIQIEGTVEHIGWRQTRIRTFDKRPLYVPNSTFAQISVENPSRMSNRRIYETIGIRYDDAAQLRGIVADVKQMLKNHPEIDTNQTLIVNFNSFAASSLDFFIYTFTKTTQWVKFHEIKQDVLLSVFDIIVEHGADIAYPTSTIKMSPTELEESLTDGD